MGSSRIVRVATDPPYEVRIGRGILGEVAAATERFSRRALVTDDVVAALHADRLGLGAPSIAVPAGEGSKTLAALERVLDCLARADLDRASCVVALGGGVVGDLAGLAASLYMRGVALIQAPTTLLAQVDASVGGKTAVNLAAGKNLAGTFHQPAAVFADVSTLSTLPEAEYRSGLGEVVKSALIDGEEALSSLEGSLDRIAPRDPDVLIEIVERCVRLKARIVALDPFDTDQRRSLNLGHTFAHAIERAAGYGRIPHGIAVGTGLTLALRTSREVGLLEDSALPDRIERLLEGLGICGDLASLREEFGVRLPSEEILAGMHHDKKGAAGATRLVLPRATGKIEVEVEARELGRILERL